MAKYERNDPCHCGSEKKYKKCCLDRDREVERGERPAATIDGSVSPTVKDGHIVPRMYQAAWEGEGRRVAVHKVDGGDCKTRSTKSVTTRGAYYRRVRPEGESSDDVEDSLRRIEDKASEPLRRLIAGGPLEAEQKGILAQFFSVQIFRSPAFFAQREAIIRPFFESGRVRPAASGEGPVRAALPLHRPADALKRGKQALRLGRAPGAHAALNDTSMSAGFVSPCSSRSASTLRASA